MSIQKRSTYIKQSKSNVGNGPYLARIISHLDSSFMGRLKVTLLRNSGNISGEETQTFVVNCATPFFGYTGFEFTGLNSAADSSTLDAYNDTQKSYGMWMVPPDVGVTVLVVFVDGDPSQGYWIGCIPANFANHMVPAIAGSNKVDYSASDKAVFNTNQPLPVAEINKKINRANEEIDPKKIKKPLHPIAERFLEQGLLEDDARGTTNSTAQREVPSMVFGISTPGPRDKRPNAIRKLVGTRDNNANTYVSRLGGTQFVMDDGDERLQRKTPASKGPVEYANVLAGEKGDPTLPYNEYFRVRTRTGHQLLMHNTEDLIYIGNARGTTWIELTSNGKIDIYAQDSVNIHTENDLNIRADRDINMEAGRNVNIKATAEYKDPENLHGEKSPFDSANLENGRVYIESVQNMDLLIGRNGKIHVRNDEGIQGNLDVKVLGNMRIAVQDKDSDPSHTNVTDLKILEEQPEEIQGLHIYSYENTRIYTDKNLDISTKGDVKIGTKGNLDLNSKGNNAYTAGGTTDILSGGNHTETAAMIHMNGPTAKTAKEAEVAEVADKVRKLPLFDNIKTNFNNGWQQRYLESKPVQSIMRRIPMHEPWPQHENFAPNFLTPQDTDREV